MMLRVALTGGIATGKSYVLARLATAGVPTIDADRVARELVGPGRPASREIRARFGAEVFAADGTLDRARLATRVFDDETERAALEAILHPRVRTRIDRWFEAVRAEAAADYAVADIPLLFETGRAADFDRVVVTACAPERQLERLMTRDGVSVEAARKRLDAQLPTSVKVEGGDFVVWTDGDHADTDRQVDEVHVALTGLARAPEAS